MRAQQLCLAGILALLKFCFLARKNEEKSGSIWRIEKGGLCKRAAGAN